MLFLPFFYEREDIMARKSIEEKEQENQIAKEVKILDLAESFGYSFRKAGSNYICRDNPGFVIFQGTNSFFDYYKDSGGSTIDLVMEEKNVSLREAIQFLLRFAGYEIAEDRVNNSLNIERIRHREEQRKIIKKAEEKIFKLPEKADTYKRVFAYLSKTRHIDTWVIQKMMKEKRLYESKENHNAIFVGTDVSGNARHAFVRGTITGVQYRGDVYGSDKNYGFQVAGKTDTLVLFEAPIDLLSYMSLLPKSEDHLLALGMIKSAAPVYTYLKEHPNIKKLSFVFDYDKYAIEAQQDLSKQFADQGYEILKNEIYEQLKQRNIKDVNLLLCQMREKEEREQICKGGGVCARKNHR